MNIVRASTETGAATGEAGRELLRALGAVASSPPPHCAAAARSLDLPVPTAAEHTGVFVLSAPPHAAIHLGENGKLGGEGLDRVAGFWRALGLTPPSDADHLGALLMLHAELGDAAACAGGERTRERMERARDALLWEHLWSWAPGYLSAVERLDTPALAPWARLTLRALAREAARARPLTTLPLALRSAPPPLTASADAGSDPGGGTGAYTADGMGANAGGGEPPLLDVLMTPVRSGVLFLREDLRAGAEAIGVGYRLGERRYTLQAMLDQDTDATLAWLGAFADRWANQHLGQPGVNGPDPRHWWAERAAGTARTLRELQRRFVAAG